MASINLSLTEEQRALKAGVADICKRYPGEYWRDLDVKREYPEAFVTELTRAGYMAALIPQEFGGSGLGVTEGSLILQTIHEHGGNAAACHAQMYIMGTVLRHGSDEQKQQYLPKIATGDLRLQAFGVTEPNAGSDTTQLQTTAVRKGDRYIVNGRKMFISRVLQSDRREPGRAVPDLARPHISRSRRAHARQGGRTLRYRRAVRSRSEHGEVPRGRGGVGRGQCVHRLSRRLRLRRGIRHRAEVPRVPALQDRAHQQQPRARLRRRAHPAHAAVVLRRARPDSPPGAARYRSLNRMPLGREKRSAWNSESS